MDDDGLYAEFLDRRKYPPPEKAKQIAFAILADITDRRGFRHQWDQIDDDIKDEVIARHIEIVEDLLSEAP